MSFYRIYKYPLKLNAYKHIHFKRDRAFGSLKQKKPENVAKLDESLCRTRRLVRDLILCNQFEYFCTFTFNEQKIDRYNFDVCQKRLTRLFDNYKQRYAPDFRYVIIPEFHKDGAVHFHGVVKGIRPGDFTVPEYVWKRDTMSDQLLLVQNTKKYVDWQYYSKKLGFFSCSKIRKYEACARYVTKYITKELASSPVGKGRRCFMASKGLRKPELIFDCDDIPLMFEPEYQDDFVHMAYLNEDWTYGHILPPWAEECCSDLTYDFSVEQEQDEPIFVPVTGEQQV